MFADNLKKVRIASGLSQDQVAQRIFKSQQAYAKYELGKASPDPDTLLELSKIFGVSVDHLLNGEEDTAQSLPIVSDCIGRVSTTNDVLKNLRKRKGLLQKDVASRLGVDRTTYVKYETGTSEPDDKTLLALAEIFGVSVDYLLGKSEQKEKSAVDDSELSENDKMLVEMMSELPDDKFAQVLDYVKFLLTQQ